MTQEKQLLLQDICGRLPYRVIGLIHIVNGNDYNIIITGGDIDLLSQQFIIIKPYLRSMSSMTEEERIESLEFAWIDDYGRLASYDKNIPKYIDWLNKKMFDYRGLIPMGLALEAPEGMYNVTK